MTHHICWIIYRFLKQKLIEPTETGKQTKSKRSKKIVVLKRMKWDSKTLSLPNLHEKQFCQPRSNIIYCHLLHSIHDFYVPFRNVLIYRIRIFFPLHSVRTSWCVNVCVYVYFTAGLLLLGTTFNLHSFVFLYQLEKGANIRRRVHKTKKQEHFYREMHSCFLCCRVKVKRHRTVLLFFYFESVTF